jgi:hypothetical protein
MTANCLGLGACLESAPHYACGSKREYAHYSLKPIWRANNAVGFKTRRGTGMTMHMRVAATRQEIWELLAPWRSQYPKFGALIDEGTSLPKALRYLGLSLWQDGRLADAAGILQMAATAAPDPTS